MFKIEHWVLKILAHKLLREFCNPNLEKKEERNLQKSKIRVFRTSEFFIELKLAIIFDRKYVKILPIISARQ